MGRIGDYLADIGRSLAAFKFDAPSPSPASNPAIGLGGTAGCPGVAVIADAEGAAGGGGGGGAATEVDCAWRSCCLRSSFSSCIFFIIA